MKKKYFILAVTFLCLLVGPNCRADDWDDFNGWDDETTDFLDAYEALGNEIDVYETAQDYINEVNHDDDDYNDWELQYFTDPDLVGTIINYQFNESTGIATWDEYVQSVGWFPVDYSSNDDQYIELIDPYGPYEAPEQEDDQYPDDDDDDDTSNPDPDNNKNWYLDNDGDGYDAGRQTSESSPGIGWIEGTSKGPDCDDDPKTGKLVHKINKCGKCEVEPESTDWKISDVIDNATGLLKDMIDKAKQIAPNLKIIKSGNHQGAKTKVKCAEINIGENAAEIKSNSILAFELSHIINTNLYNTTFKNGLLKTKADFVKSAALFEAEGSIFSQIIKNTEAKTLNDCEKSLLAISTLKQDYSNLTVDQIKNQIRQNDELNSKAEDLIKNGIVVSTGKTFVQKYEADYDRYQELITWYRKVKKLSDSVIATKLRNEKTDCK